MNVFIKKNRKEECKKIFFLIIFFKQGKVTSKRINHV